MMTCRKSLLLALFAERHNLLQNGTERLTAIPPSNTRPPADVKNGNPGNEDQTAVLSKTKTKRPSLYRVLLLNDDYTPMEFVIHVLQNFFNKSQDDATQIMLHVHHRGVGECGTFTYEIAETKVTQVMDFARRHEHPLQCVMEKT